MEMNNEAMMSKVRAAADGVVAVAILIAVLTIGGELYAPLKGMLKDVFSHHWLGKCALAIVSFAIVFIIRFRVPTDSQKLACSVRSAAWWSLASALAMTLFFTAHTLHWF